MRSAVSEMDTYLLLRLWCERDKATFRHHENHMMMHKMKTMKTTYNLHYILTRCVLFALVVHTPENQEKWGWKTTRKTARTLTEVHHAI